MKVTNYATLIDQYGDLICVVTVKTNKILAVGDQFMTVHGMFEVTGSKDFSGMINSRFVRGKRIAGRSYNLRGNG